MKHWINRLQAHLGARKPLLRFILWFGLLNTSLFWIVGSKYLLIIFSSKSLFEMYFAYTSILGKAFVILFTLISFAGHFALLAFLPVLLILLPLVILFNSRWLTFCLSVLLGTVSIILLLTDSIVYTNYHFHLTTELIRLVSEYGMVAFFELSQREIMIIVSSCLCVLGVEILVVIGVWKQIISKNKWLCEKKIIAALAGCLYFSYLILIFSLLKINLIFAEQTPNLPLYNVMLAALIPKSNSLDIIESFSNTRFSQPLFPNAPLHYPLHRLSCHRPLKPYNILVIGIDTWRFDAMNKTLTPGIQQFAKGAWQFNQHLSGGNSTQAGLFSLFYSLPSNYWTSMLQQKQGAVFFHELLQKGYDINIQFSSIMIPPFDQTMFYELKNLRTTPAPGATIPDKDRYITEAFKQFLTKRKRDQPFFTFLLYDAVHDYCEPQNIPKRYPATNQNCIRLILTDKNSRSDIYNRYKNAVHFVDDQVTQLLTLLKEKDYLKNTIVIITSDHGEEFNDNQLNYWGHSSNYTDYQIKTPLIIYWPNTTPKVWTHQTSHYDIVPFLMKKVLGCENPSSDYSIGSDLLDKKSRPYVLVGSYIDMAIVEKDINITLRTSGQIRVSDNHARRLTHVKPDVNIIAKALLEMRKYYQYQKL